MSAAGGGEWLSFHLFYHGDRERVLTGWVRPVVAALWTSGGIERFYFIRYALGGPHIRLRVLARPGRTGAVEEQLVSSAEGFLRLWPSPVPLPEEEIRAANRAILANDGGEEEDGVYPDNTLRRFPLRFEVARYGGPGMLAPTLDFFTLSSLQALRFLEAHGGKPAPRRLAATFGLLARQVCGLAGGEEEVLALLEYPAQSWERLSPLGSRADQAFEERRESFQALFRAEAGRLARCGQPAPGSPEAEVAAARLLALEIGSAPDPVRRRIASSHLHMTANRLGLRNTDEVYLSRLLWRTVASLAASGAELRERLESLHAAPPVPRLEDLVPQEMAQALAQAGCPSDNPPNPGAARNEISLESRAHG